MADKESTFPWFRFYTEAAHDIKIESIAEETGIEYLVIFGAWTTLLCLASESPIRGSLYVTDLKRYSNVTVTNKLHCTKELSDQLIKSFISFDMLDTDENGAYRITHWLKRNPPSDNSLPRVQKSRAKEKDETLQDRDSNGIDLDLNKDIDILNTVPKKSSKEPVHPAISAYHRVTGKYPNKAIYPQVIDTLGDAPDEVFMSECWASWCKVSQNPSPYRWLFDWYKNKKVTVIGTVQPKSNQDQSMEAIRQFVEESNER